jgi:hypothetical protein
VKPERDDAGCKRSFKCGKDVELKRGARRYLMLSAASLFGAEVPFWLKVLFFCFLMVTEVSANSMRVHEDTSPGANAYRSSGFTTLAALMTMMAIISAALLLGYDFSKFRFVSKPPQNADSGVSGVHLVDEVILVGALEAASGGNDYDDPGGWGSLIADAIERNEVVCEEHLSTQVHGLEIGATPVAAKPKTKVSFFITDVLMAQNGVEFVAGVDTYNGTTAYTSYDTYKRCGGNSLLKIDLRVAHVGGGQLKIHGLWKNVQFMNHGQPFRTLDIVVGDFRVMTCECLLGIPALHNMSAVIDCRAGLMDFEDDNGEVQIFGKNRSKITREPVHIPLDSWKLPTIVLMASEAPPADCR